MPRIRASKPISIAGEMLPFFVTLHAMISTVFLRLLCNKTAHTTVLHSNKIGDGGTSNLITLQDNL